MIIIIKCGGRKRYQRLQPTNVRLWAVRFSSVRRPPTTIYRQYHWQQLVRRSISTHTHASSHAFNQLNWPILSFLRQNLLGPDYTEISSTLKEEHANGRKGKRSCTYNTTDFCCKRMESDDDKQLPTMRAHEPLPAPTFSYTLYKYFCFFKPTKCKDDDRL